MIEIKAGIGLKPAMRRRDEMRTWGDVVVVLNGMIREGGIAGFRTNRNDKGAEPSIEVMPAPGQSDDDAVALVRSVLTSNFAGTPVVAALA